jgi:hypothetical protein
MALSGTYTFNLDVLEIVEDAYEQAGLEVESGFQLKSAARGLDLLLIDWLNDGVNLWTIDQVTQAITADTRSYTLDAKWTDILDAVIRSSDNIDIPLRRVSLSEYMQLPDKTTTGVSSLFSLERNSSGGHTLYIWPTPDVSTYSFVGWGMRYMQDIGSYTNNVDIPKRFLPALIAGLAYRVGKLNPGRVSQQKMAELKMDYMDLYNRAKMEDRDRTSVFIVPARRR